MSPEPTSELLANLRVALDTAVHRVNQFKGLGLLALEAAITGEMDDSAPMTLRLDERRSGTIEKREEFFAIRMS